MHSYGSPSYEWIASVVDEFENKIALQCNFERLKNFSEAKIIQLH